MSKNNSIELTPGTTLHGFTVIKQEELREIDGFAYEMTHSTSKAKLLYLQNADSDKAFSIAFKTPPQDSTGVFHILEHSVLCGSDKFPVKEPFVNLLKTSMQTFLNAMTFPDKTMYPVASTNQQDLLNLMDVYMDAAFHPAIYQKETIFQQEGWHFERNDEGHLEYNGVVFNEMKGALSDPDDVLTDGLQEELFPDTCYRFESGGNPNVIPTLTYEQFLSEHAQHYRLDNSYIVLYGDMDIDVVLEWLDSRYLSVIKPNANALKPRTIELQKPVISTNRVIPMDIPKESATYGIGYIMGTAHDRTKAIATEILIDAVAGSNESPLKRKLMDTHLFDDVSIALMDSLYQPFVGVAFRGTHKETVQDLLPTFTQCAREVLTEGIDHSIIAAALNHAEFLLREANYSYSTGVIYAINAMAGWLYNDDDATSYLRYEEALKTLRQNLETSYFEELFESLFLTNNHYAAVEVSSDAESSIGDQVNIQRLEAIEASMNESDFEEIDARLASLREAQEKPDSPEELATLPRLTKEDIAEAPRRASFSVHPEFPVKTVLHDITTHGICYSTRYYDLRSLTYEDIPYVSLMCKLIGKLGTQTYSPSELDTLLLDSMGAFSLSTKAVTNPSDPYDVACNLALHTSCLQSNIETMAELTEDVIHKTCFNDKERIRAILTQTRVRFEDSFINSGHSHALNRSLSYCLPAHVLMQNVSGVDYYFFIKDLLEHFDENFEKLQSKLEYVYQKVFCESYTCMSYVGTPESLDAYFSIWTKSVLPSRDEIPPQLTVPTPEIKHEGFIIPSDISFSAISWDWRLLDKAERDPQGKHGAWLLAQRLLSFDYLWNEVRVKGGAYGTGFKSARSGSISYYSYRDPRFDETLDRFEDSCNWLSTYNPTEEELEGYIVSTVSGIDKPLKPSQQMLLNDTHYLLGTDPEQYLNDRKDVLEATPDQIQALSENISRALAKNAYCVFGNKTIIEGAKRPLNRIELL